MEKGETYSARDKFFVKPVSGVHYVLCIMIQRILDKSIICVKRTKMFKNQQPPTQSFTAGNRRCVEDVMKAPVFYSMLGEARQVAQSSVQNARSNNLVFEKIYILP